MRKQLALLPILLAYLGIGALFIRYTPAWQAPDEPAHYNYVRQLAAGRLPVIAAGDYDQAYLMTVVFISGFDPQYSLEPIEYEDWQPPLYYLLQTPVYLATNGLLPGMRTLSLLLGAGVVILAYAIVLRIAPEERWLALTTAVFVAFLPQHLAILTSVNNDALAELLIAAILWILVGFNRPIEAIKLWEYVLLGILIGLGFLTKGTVYPLAIVAGLALLWRYWRNWTGLVRAGFLVFLPALLIGALWWGRNMAVYGGLDILGKGAHDTVVVGQPRTAEWIAQFGLQGTINQFVATTLNSFWGQFGWMTVPMTYPAWLYPLLWIFLGLGVAGLIVAAAAGRRQWARFGLPALVFLGLFFLTSSVHLVYNLTFVQHQGRYLFPALIPIALGLAIGLGLWFRPLKERQSKLIYALPLGLGAAMIALDLYALFRVIVPALG